MLRGVKTEEIERTRAGRYSKRVSEIAAKKIGEWSCGVMFLELAAS